MSDDTKNYKRKDEARSVPAQLGYITAKVEDLTTIMDTHVHASATRSDKLEKRMERMEDSINTTKTIIKVVKFVLGAVILIITLKVGDVAGLWHKLFG